MQALAAHAELKSYRLAVSRARGQPAFCVFSNAVLDAICAAMPASEAALYRIPGLGKTKVAEHGAAILQICGGGRASAGGVAAAAAAFQRRTSSSAAAPVPTSVAPAAMRHSEAWAWSAPGMGLIGDPTLGSRRTSAPVSPPGPAGAGGGWSEADDRYLWDSQHAGTAALASHFGRTAGSIRARLTHLNNPEHKAYVRRMALPAAATMPVKRSGLSKASGDVIDLTSPKRPRLSPECQEERGAAAAPAPSVRLEQLSSEQGAAARRALAGENLFITGAAGTGKSFLLRYIIEQLQARLGVAAVAVTAPTGIAAVNISGSTVHSWAGVGLGRGDPQKILGRVLSGKAQRNWRSARGATTTAAPIPNSCLVLKLLRCGCSPVIVPACA